ncbi:MAG: GGDEF domain-containing protein [Proteobacteria bacterium]|nr:GGDEF domain-containing protein [Pseudomonadota bacterium]
MDLAIESDLQNFVCFLMESVERLQGNVFRASLACLKLNQRFRLAGACCGQTFPVSAHLKNHRLLVHWDENEYPIVQLDTAEPPMIDQLRDYLRKSTESIDPEILIQRNEAMAHHLHETQVRAEQELAGLEAKLLHRQTQLQISIRQAETDPLTGLLNRRAFDEKLDLAFRHTMRQKSSPLSLMMLDLDYFKDINDEHGHQYGDNYLIKMAKIILSVIREDVDYAFRFGGDEFAMMIHSDYVTACDKARQVIQQMDGRVSIGISTIGSHRHDDLTLEAFIHQADSSLYEAKHRGRGRAVVGGCSINDAKLCGTVCAMKESGV